VVFSKRSRGCIGKKIAMKAVVGVLEKWDLTAEGVHTKG
jgi:hypothetical protein